MEVLMTQSREPTMRSRRPLMLVCASMLLVAGCATRPINPSISQADPTTGYRFETRHVNARDKDNLVVLAFSGGGTRAAAFSYGVLEFLRRTEIVGPKGNKVRLLDEVDQLHCFIGGDIWRDCLHDSGFAYGRCTHLGSPLEIFF